jgi:2-dehydropantoate 2-reductase
VDGGSALVLGVGAIGATTGGGMLLAGGSAVLVDTWFENVETIRRRGLTLTLDDTPHQTPATVLYPDELGRLQAPAQVVLLACKSYDTDAMVRLIEPHLAPDGVIVSLQNGINEDRIAAIVGPERTLGCVVHYSGAMMHPAHAVRFSPTAWHSYSVGELDGSESERAARVAALLAGAGPSVTTTDIYGALWAKLAINCMVNALTAATGLSTPALWGSPLGLTLMLRLAAECARVAGAQGRRMRPLRLIASGREVSPELLLDAAADEHVRALMDAEAAARAAGPRSEEIATSMLQDMRKRRRPEIDYLNGYVVAEGARLGVQTPVNAAVVELLKQVASGDLPQETAHLERVAAALEAISGSPRSWTSPP